MPEDEEPFVLRLTPELLIDIHNQIMQDTGEGSKGVRSHSVLKNCVDYPFTKVYGQSIFPTIFLKAAALLHAIITWHPFINGNKRTALAATYQFLKLNGYTFSIPSDFMRVVLPLAAKEVDELEDIPKLAQWIKRNSTRNPSSAFGSLKARP